jgi:hypothetical protein
MRPIVRICCGREFPSLTSNAPWSYSNSVANQKRSQDRRIFISGIKANMPETREIENNTAIISEAQVRDGKRSDNTMVGLGAPVCVMTAARERTGGEFANIGCGAACPASGEAPITGQCFPSISVAFSISGVS